MMGCNGKIAFFTALLFCGSLALRAQTTQTVTFSSTDTSKTLRQVPKPKVKRPKPISKELSGGIRLNTDGWSIFAERGVVKSEERESDLFYNLRFFSIEISEKKHPKEKRTTSGGGGPETSNSYIFGKINNFYTVKLGYGSRRLIAGKPDPGTVSIHWVNSGGLSLGMLKPYYLTVSSGENIKYTDANRDEFLAGYNIAGSAGLSKGFGEMKVVPGLHFRTGLHFDFAPRERKKSKLAIETGINGELYAKNIELMANQKAVPYFVNLYLSFQFGRRWE